MKNSGSNEETRVICRSPDIITLMKVMLLQSIYCPLTNKCTFY